MQILRGRGKPSEDRILREIKDVRALVASTAKTAEAARQSAAEAVAKLRESQEAESAGLTRRTVGLTVFCLGLLAAAGICTSYAVMAFADPIALPAGFNSVELVVQAPKPTSLPLENSAPNVKFYVYQTFYSQDGRDYAAYEVLAPAKEAGKKYVLMLEGSARLGAPSEIDGTPAVRSNSVTFSYSSAYYVTPTTGPCQLVRGTFPVTLNGGAAKGNPLPDSCDGTGGSPWKRSDDDVGIEIIGKSHLVTSASWAYQTYSLPGFTGSLIDRDAYLNSWAGGKLGGWYRSGNPVGCRVDELATDGEVTDISRPATQSSQELLAWQPTDAGGAAAVVIRGRDAEEIGNALLAIGAATAALAIGFIPVAYDTNRQRRARKRQHG